MAKQVAFSGFRATGLARFSRRKLKGRLLILTYHAFCETEADVGGPTGAQPIDALRQQLQYLGNNFAVVSLGSWLADPQAYRSERKPLAAITIDDGYEDTDVLAFPCFLGARLPFTVFLATDFLDTGRPPWPVRMWELLLRTSRQKMSDPLPHSLATPADRVAARLALKKLLCRMAPEERFRILDAMACELQVGETGVKPLAWDRVRALQKQGVEFGSHSRFHSMLPFMPDEVIEMEVSDSRRRIAEETGVVPDLFCYPNGDHSEPVRMAVKKAGYGAAVTQEPGANVAGDDLSRLKRIQIPHDDTIAAYTCRTSLLAARIRTLI